MSWHLLSDLILIPILAYNAWGWRTSQKPRERLLAKVASIITIVAIIIVLIAHYPEIKELLCSTCSSQ